MRLYGLVLAAVVLTAVPMSAQTPPGTPPGAAPGTPGAAAASAKLDGYLLRWEQEMRKVQTLSAALNRIDKDKVADVTRKLTGYALYMKAGSGGPTTLNLALLELKEEGRSDIYEKFICTGTYLYQFVPASKEIRAYEIPKPKPGQVSDDNFLSFLFGMKAEEARRRYNLTMAKEDTWYIYVDVVARDPADKHDFSRARLVLNKDSFLPRQLWFEHPNGNETTWDIPTLKPGVVPDRRVFDAPKAPPGWKIVPVPREPAAVAPPTAPMPPRPGTVRP
jgi:TIGR03009 family protein